MSEREAFIAELSNLPLRKGDVIILLQGDGHARVPCTVELFKNGYAPKVLVVGGDTRREYGSYPSSELREELIAQGVPESAILFDDTAAHTRAQAEYVMNLAKEHGWKSFLIVASPYHMFRAFLTFLKAMQDADLDLDLQPAPARDIPWHSVEPWGIRSKLLVQELERVDTYGTQGDVATYAEGLAYLAVNESLV